MATVIPIFSYFYSKCISCFYIYSRLDAICVGDELPCVLHCLTSIFKHWGYNISAKCEHIIFPVVLKTIGKPVSKSHHIIIMVIIQC